jgi:hypothetical protein
LCELTQIVTSPPLPPVAPGEVLVKEWSMTASFSETLNSSQNWRLSCKLPKTNSGIPSGTAGGISTELVGLISRLVDLVPWPVRRSAMGDVVLTLLDGKLRVAEDVFGWGRSTVTVGVKEFQTGLVCVNAKPLDLNRKQKRNIPSYLRKYVTLWNHRGNLTLICAPPCCTQL